MGQDSSKTYYIPETNGKTYVIYVPNDASSNTASSIVGGIVGGIVVVGVLGCVILCGGVDNQTSIRI